MLVLKDKYLRQSLQQLNLIRNHLIQMQVHRQLTRQQQEEYTKVRNCQNGMDEKTYDLCLKYFLQYKSNTAGHIPTEKLQIVFKSALFMAQKSQNIENVKGERIILPSITLGQLLKTHQLDQVMITLKDFSKNVKVADKEAASDLNNLIKQISFLITFHKKFEKSIEKLQPRERLPESSGPDYLKNWSSFAWILYIQVKNKAFHKSLDLIENTCMLAHTIAFMLTFAWDYLVPKAILKQEKRITEQSTLKEVLPVLRDRVLQMFSIKTMDMYASIANKFQTFFELQLEKKGIVKNTNQNSDFLSPELLPQNYKRLDKLYEKSMGVNDLDERIFFRERMANLTPSKFTPFARQGYANKGKKTNANDTTYKQNFSSHRILNYQMIDKQQTTMKGMNEGINIGKLPKTVLISPSSTMKVQLICQTPITTGMEMYNYVNQKARKFKQILNQGQIVKRHHQTNAVKHIEVMFEKGKKDIDKKTKQLRQSLIYSLFKLALEDYLSQYPSQKDNQSIYQGLMAMSIQIVLFVCNSNLTFEDIEKQVNVSPFQLWKACHFFLKFDKSMPSALKLHLLDTQVSLISYKLWKQWQNLEVITKIANGQKQKEADMVKTQFVDKLFRRVLHQTAYMISQLGSSLKLQEPVIQNIFELMKIIYTDHIYLLQNHNIDQLVMCSIFAINKIQKRDLKFGEIIEVYQQVNQYNKDIHDVVIYKITVKERQPINLIAFYNQFFINQVKYVLQMKNTTIDHKDHKKNFNSNNPILQSPLKDILPRQMNKKNSKKATKDGNTNLLISYNDSPLLKHQPLSFKAGQNPKTKKIIDFDYQQRQRQKQYQKLSPRAVTNVNLPLEFNKKFSNATPNFNQPWKAPIQQPTLNINGLTPTRISKNLSNLNNQQLNQFTTNPTPPTSSKTTNNLPLRQPTMNGFNRGSARTNFQ